MYFAHNVIQSAKNDLDFWHKINGVPSLIMNNLYVMFESDQTKTFVLCPHEVSQTNWGKHVLTYAQTHEIPHYFISSNAVTRGTL